MCIVIMICRVVLWTRTIRTRFLLQMENSLLPLFVFWELRCWLFPIPFIYNLLHVILARSWTFFLSFLFVKPRAITNISTTRFLSKLTLKNYRPTTNPYLYRKIPPFLSYSNIKYFMLAFVLVLLHRYRSLMVITLFLHEVWLTFSFILLWSFLRNLKNVIPISRIIITRVKFVFWRDSWLKEIWLSFLSFRFLVLDGEWAVLLSCKAFLYLTSKRWSVNTPYHHYF
jgi:hypothetical protein